MFLTALRTNMYSRYDFHCTDKDQKLIFNYYFSSIFQKVHIMETYNALLFLLSHLFLQLLCKSYRNQWCTVKQIIIKSEINAHLYQTLRFFTSVCCTSTLRFIVKLGTYKQHGRVSINVFCLMLYNGHEALFYYNSILPQNVR